MTLKLQALLSFFAGRQQRNEHARSCLTVIPAKAGIQLNMRPKDTAFFMLSAAHNVFALDSSLLKAEHIHVLSPRAGFRRNDERFDLAVGSPT
ncbi:hypothetical protein [Dyella sp.]|uniref:hypothetical protein n=1 Tax=Dyella sp. TaxID=1869338 RepID=UPI002B476696|nr:hypothetical protein [Dyella sp.]HKT29992.1 hypothetical protein [Dyella sp.]